MKSHKWWNWCIVGMIIDYHWIQWKACQNFTSFLHLLDANLSSISAISWQDRVVVFYSTFNNISVISWRSVLLVEETGGPGENHWPIASHWQTLSHNVVSSTPRLSGVRTLSLYQSNLFGHCVRNNIYGNNLPSPHLLFPISLLLRWASKKS
jgi:hypothetical protein